MIIFKEKIVYYSRTVVHGPCTDNLSNFAELLLWIALIYMLIAGVLGMQKQGRKSTKTRREAKQLAHTVQETREKLLKI
ncbi:Oidioi.mRNA.OKI2018_I69.XSR.g13858.t1.cds [Oikopleura dioica]|uniref:Oidioi.mRNA.OKI2018_I69.XSR.g13858.t1.cds n=1 Tax=Oikopleura dioica TaxID=34765 RepID=A0ABN7SF65_OIKDI|nr:Oidioi.mRNA.OKI2018_I69.XSR.g13858.t1.cds [Oikopleura dioica]